GWTENLMLERSLERAHADAALWVRLSSSLDIACLTSPISARVAGRKDLWRRLAAFRKLRRAPGGAIPLFGYAPQITQTREGPGCARPLLRWYGGAAAVAPSVRATGCLLDVRRQVERIRRDVRIGHDRCGLLGCQAVAVGVVRVAFGRVLVGDVVPGHVAPGHVTPRDVAPGHRLPRDALPGDVRPRYRAEVGARPGGRAPRDRVPVGIGLGRAEPALRVERWRCVAGRNPDELVEALVRVGRAQPEDSPAHLHLADAERTWGSRRIRLGRHHQGSLDLVRRVGRMRGKNLRRRARDAGGRERRARELDRPRG